MTAGLVPSLAGRLGWTIVSIDDVEPLAAIQAFAEAQVQDSNDAAARFTASVRALHFSARPLRSFPLPREDNVTLLLRDPKSGVVATEVAPWFASSLLPLDSLDRLTQRCLRSSPPPSVDSCPGADSLVIASKMRIARSLASERLDKSAIVMHGALLRGMSGMSPQASVQAMGAIAEPPGLAKGREMWVAASNRWGRNIGDGAEEASHHQLPPWWIETLANASVIPWDAVRQPGRLVEATWPSKREERLLEDADAAASSGGDAEGVLHDWSAEDGVTVSLTKTPGGAATGVVVAIPTFNPSYVAACFAASGRSLCSSATQIAATESCFAAAVTKFLARTVTAPAEAAIEFGVNKLVLDFRGNRGGNVLLGQLFLSYTFKALQRKPQSAGAVLRLRRSPDLSAMARFVEASALSTLGATIATVFPSFALLDALVIQPPSSASTGDSVEVVKPAGSLADFSWFTEGERVRLGSRHSHVSQPFRLTDLSKAVSGGLALAKGLEWNASNTAIISDLLCGSMCGQVLRTAQEQGMARVVGVGGLPFLQGDTAAFIGGYVVGDVEQIAAEGRVLQGLGYSGTVLPYFHTSARFGFNFGMAMSFHRTETPMQFAAVGPDLMEFSWTTGGGLPLQALGLDREVVSAAEWQQARFVLVVVVSSLTGLCALLLVCLCLCFAHIRTEGEVWHRCKARLCCCRRRKVRPRRATTDDPNDDHMHDKDEDPAAGPAEEPTSSQRSPPSVPASARVVSATQISASARASVATSRDTGRTSVAASPGHPSLVDEMLGGATGIDDDA